jgi:hypothetical protein
VAGTVGAAAATALLSCAEKLATITEAVGVAEEAAERLSVLWLAVATWCCCSSCCGAVEPSVELDEQLLAAAEAARLSPNAGGAGLALAVAVMDADTLQARDSWERSGAYCLAAWGLLDSGDSRTCGFD